MVAWADPPSDAARVVDGGGVVDLLSDIESLADATGALTFHADGAAVGNVLLEGGRVCWAVASGMNRRLTDLLRHEASPPLERSVIEAVYRRCRETGSALGESLVASGLVSADGLRRALRQHTAEAMARLSGDRALARTFAAHKRQRYDARYTFLPAELLVGIGALRARDIAHELEGTLAALAPSGAMGAAFLAAGERQIPLPLASIGLDDAPVRAIATMGLHAVRALRTASALGTGRQVVVAQLDTGESLVVYEEDEIVFAWACSEPSSRVYLLASRRRAASSRLS